MTRSIVPTALSAAVFGLLAATPALAQNPNYGIAGTGQELEVEIICHDVLDEGDTSFTVDVCAKLGPPEVLNVNVLFVIDLSGSMEDDAGAGGDANGDGLSDSYLDAAVVSLISLLDSMQSSNNIDIAVVGFASGAATADVSPAVGLQTWTSPLHADLDTDTVKDIEQVLRSSRIRANSFGTFTPTLPAIGVFTNYTAALDACNTALALQPPGETNIIYWVSDGQPNVGNPFAPSLATLIANHSPTIHAYGIGADGAAACAPGGALDTLADDSGGTCTAVINPALLITLLPEAATTEIASLVLKVNGNPVASTFTRDESEICFFGVELIGFLNLLGTNTITACGATADGLQVVATKDPVKTACLLYMGFAPDNTFYVPGDVDKWLVKPRFSWNVTESQQPLITIPNNPAVIGKKAYFQVFMHNQWVFPQNAVQMSNGVELTVGTGAVPYGGATGIWAWHHGGYMPGESFRLDFDVLGM